MKAVFDSNILIDYLHGIANAADVLNQYSEKIISIITYMEVLAGVGSAESEAITRTFLANFEVRPLSQEIAEKAIELRKLHRQKLPDAIIFATAKVEGSLFLTRNTKDFDAAQVDVRIPYQI